MKFIYTIIIFFSAIALQAQNSSFDKYVIDQNKLYNLIIKDAKLVIEVRDMNKSYADVTYKLVPIETELVKQNIIWDIYEGALYIINMTTLKNENLQSSMLKYKISDLSSNLNFIYNSTSFETKNNLINRPFFDLFEKEIDLKKYRIDISVIKSFKLIAKSDSENYLFTSEDGQSWEKTKINTLNFESFVAFKNNYYINNDIVYLNLDCENCTQLKSVRDIKNFPSLIVDKDQTLLIEAPAVLELEKDMSIDLKTIVLKICRTLLFN